MTSHIAAFRAQADFPVEAKIKVGASVWQSPETAGARLYELVLSKRPSTIQKVLDAAAELKPPFTVKQVQGHLKWLYTAGNLEVDGTSYVVQAKAPKAAKVEAPKAEKPKVKTKTEAKPEPRTAAASKRRLVRTKRAA
jgi:hypothetical protein